MKLNLSEKTNKISSSFKRFKNNQTAKKIRITYQILWNLALIFMILIILGIGFTGGLGAGYFRILS